MSVAGRLPVSAARCQGLMPLLARTQTMYDFLHQLRIGARNTRMENSMKDRNFVAATGPAVALLATLLLAPTGAAALDETKYPDLKGQWDRVGPPNWTQAGPPPITPEYQKVYEA